MSFLDTADRYAFWGHEVLVGKAIRDRRDKVFWPTNLHTADRANPHVRAVSGKPELRSGGLAMQAEEEAGKWIRLTCNTRIRVDSQYTN